MAYGEYTLGQSDSFMVLVKSLYENPDFINNLNEIKQRMRNVTGFTTPQFDDIEAEIVCLLLMNSNPNFIYEMSPGGGWSTLYMLNTLDVMNNTNCKVISYDINDSCSANINQFTNLSSKWQFYLDNVENRYNDFTEIIDYLFIDCDNSLNFTQKYIDELLKPLLAKLKNINKKIFVSLHDVFHTHIPSEDGALVINFLTENNIEYFSPLNRFHNTEIHSIRNNSVNLDISILHYGNINPGIFFILG